MTVINNDKVAMVDCDDTLIIWAHTAKKLGLEEEFLNKRQPFTLDGENIMYAMPNPEMLDFIHNLKAQGITLVAWSRAGHRWADYILQSLDIRKLFDVVMTKPYLILDDKPVEHLGTNTWVGPSK